ncbi:YrdB family protein [Actinotalea fermentans]|uniref:DUF2568 domain-containing protein n=1 Tax=Actinotalea fermentans TaxID=43671 RepID=A0A511Z1R7_9CELL|nr:YrdB family protein [Actinotalea fermentans]KGM17011.1 hypothetical protein N867_11955 [Actinotalea fermentans ATCC 43279 = JCM 9966 = DSM 3133]GEN81392.1 hypothetical protein AFE02nite_31260 [Actinotalea fermentans]
MENRAVNANDLLAFLVELAALAVLCAFGFQVGGPTAARVALGVGLPLVAAVAWGLFAAPRARYDVPALRLVTKVVVLGGAAAASFGVLPLGAAVAFAVVVVVNLTLMYVGPFAR